jgi:hypothetical protein
VAAERAATAAIAGGPVPSLERRQFAVARQTDAGVPMDAGTGDAGSSSQIDQTNCVIRLGGCPNSRSGGIPSGEEITSYNAQCRGETSYTGPDITPSGDECAHPPTHPAARLGRPGATMICSKRLDAPVAGWVANHAYIDDTGRGDCHGNSMVGNYRVGEPLVAGNFIRGCATKTNTSDDPQSYTPNGKECTPKPGVTDVHACLLSAYTAYANPSEYSNEFWKSGPWGPNSNSFAATLARACCADSTDSGLGWVPGWDHGPAGPCTMPITAAAGAGAANDPTQNDQQTA